MAVIDYLSAFKVHLRVAVGRRAMLPACAVNSWIARRHRVPVAMKGGGRVTLREGAWSIRAVETHMAIPRISFKGQTINGRLLAWFLAISLIPCGILAGLTSWLSTRALEDSVRRDLMVISEAKADELETYARERLRWVTGVARIPSMVQAVTRLDEAHRKGGADSPESRLARDELRPILANMAESFGYPNLLLFSPRGDVLFRLHPDPDPGGKIQEGPLKGSGLASIVDRAVEATPAGVVRISVLSGDERAGVLHRQPDARRRGQGRRRRRLPARQQADLPGLQRLHRLGRDRRDARRRPEGRGGDPRRPLAARSVGRIPAHGRDGRTSSRRISRPRCRGERGYGVALDYRGEMVAAFDTYLPTFRWGMVVKQDADEAFAPIYQQRLAIGGLLVAILILGRPGGPDGGPFDLAADPRRGPGGRAGGLGRPDRAGRDPTRRARSASCSRRSRR